jgi:peptide/nickel transport system substrate-binding protein
MAASATWVGLGAVARFNLEKPMQEKDIRSLIEQVREGTLPRRSFIAPHGGCWPHGPDGVDAADAPRHRPGADAPCPYKPTKRGGGGTLKMIYWQAAVHLNPHYAGGTKDQDASRVFYEPLAGWDLDGNLIPALAAEIPSRANGGLSADGKSSPGSSRRA